jgi:hypothetical protein
MAKVANAEPLALEALARLLGDPAPRVLHGLKPAPGIFTGASAAEKAAARHCLDNGWIVPTGGALGKGKTRKELYRLAPAGLQAVLAKSDPTALLAALAESVRRLEERASRIPVGIEVASEAIRLQLEEFAGELRKDLTTAFRPLETMPAALEELKTALAKTLEKVKPVDLDALSKALAGNQQPPAGPPRKEASWGEEVVRIVAEQKQRNAFQRLTLPQVFERLRALHPDLTLGQFHDGMRRLHEEKRIRLGPYTQALATLDDPRNALYLDREVKFYVELP